MIPTAIAAFMVVIAAWVAILFTGRPPGHIRLRGGVVRRNIPVIA